MEKQGVEMMFKWALVAVSLCVMGCKSEVDLGDDTDTDIPRDTEDDYKGCEETEIDVNGPEEPRVGDEWTVFMRCDGAILQGPMVLQFTPNDFAKVYGNEVEFTTAGDASMRVQVGSYRENMDVTVLP